MNRYEFQFRSVEEAGSFTRATVLAGTSRVMQFGLDVVVETADLQFELYIWEWARELGGTVVGYETVAA